MMDPIQTDWETNAGPRPWAYSLQEWLDAHPWCTDPLHLIRFKLYNGCPCLDYRTGPLHNPLRRLRRRHPAPPVQSVSTGDL